MIRTAVANRIRPQLKYLNRTGKPPPNGGQIVYATPNVTVVLPKQRAAATPTLKIGPVYGADADEIARKVQQQQKKAVFLSGALQRDGD